MLKPNVFQTLTSNEISPTGWLRDQLQVQARGLVGNLDKVWPDVRDSKWIGGDREGWERVPYWLDGFIPMAWLLDDADLKARALRYIDAILAQQCEDGWLCPCTEEERPTYDVWALLLLGKVLVTYYECSGDKRVPDALYRAFRQLHERLTTIPLKDWAHVRWFEGLITIFWLYERNPEPWMLELAETLHKQGMDFDAVYTDWKYQDPQAERKHETHVVNVAMMLKQQALMSRMTGSSASDFARHALSLLEKYHGMPIGHFTGDEHLSGNSPIQGTELCGVVEAMYSYEHLLAISGEIEWADRLEFLAFNALPATTAPDMWTHQYDQQTNQVQCSKLPSEAIVFRTNDDDSHVFGLEPNYGCCTANFGQGWPKLALSTFLRTDTGLVSAVLAPSSVRLNLNGANVFCELITGYPFRSNLKYILTVAGESEFDFSIRIPGFARSATVDGEPAQPGSLHTLHRKWRGATEIAVQLDFEPHFESRPNDMVVLKRGPLLYSLPIAEKWEMHEYEKEGVTRHFPYCDYYLYPDSKWNYAFAEESFAVEEGQISVPPFSPDHAPISLWADMVEIDWQMQNDVCTPQPERRIPQAAPERLRLIPYGCTNLRMTEMPLVENK